MANSKIKALLKKIESIIGEDESISKLELDLVKSYLRDLYELTDDLGAANSPAHATRTNQATKLDRFPAEKIAPPTQPAIVKPPLQPQHEEEIPGIITPPLGMNDTGQKLPNGREDVLGAERTNILSTEAPKESTMVKEVPTVFRGEIQIPKKYDTLFEKSGTNELSDKLSRSPISDLHKALGINDRMLVVAELFAADQNKFTETMDILNGKYSFDEAKSYLIRYIIDQFNWLDEEKVERAREFIKLIERRYIER